MLPNQPGAQVPIPGPVFGPEPGRFPGRRGIGLGAPNPLAQALAALQAQGGASPAGMVQAIQTLHGAHHPAQTYPDPSAVGQGGPQRGHAVHPDFAAIVERLRGLTVNPDTVALLKQLVAQHLGS